MNKRTAIKAALASAAVVLAAASPALATTVSIGGGSWSYDDGANTAWSNYKHPDYWHSSSVSFGSTLHESGCTNAGVWSLASGNKNGYTINYYYQRTCP